ncbi:MAG: arylamine N-acetyltransferase [Bacteroidia bacterium]|nr:arylamine N-acetyltransferase [Bacteroidia bacterium]
MEIGKYLERINYSGALEPDLQLLKNLQKNHLLNIPFENLDIHYHTPIKLNIDQFYDKIIRKNRGGFCYELNGLFYELLCSLGFRVKQVSARVYSKENKYSPEYDHLTIIVTIDDTEYLTDVGFGEFIFEPLELEFGKIQNDEKGHFLIDTYENGYLRVSKLENEIASPEFIFKNEARELEAFEEMCEYHQTDPRSHFMQKRLISLPTENGRITISGDLLKIKEKNVITEKVLRNEKDFEKELWDKFRISFEKSIAEN